MRIGRIINFGSLFILNSDSLLLPKNIFSRGISFHKNRDIYLLEKYGIPNDENLVYFDKYISSINTRTKIPNWVLQYNSNIDLKQMNKTRRSGFSNFFNDNWIPKKNSYNNYSRGHLVPAGDYGDEDKKDTFYLEANIVPQDINNNKGIWNLIEKQVRNNLKSKYNEAWILSGPLFIPYNKGNKKYITYEVLGDCDIAVPNFLFKSILYKKDNDHYIDNYLVPNKDIISCNTNEFKIGLQDLENKFKYTIFPLLDRNEFQQL